jgi:putative Ca2+/H+ antiporter (TMEM165/GDT1 family)
LYFGCKLVRDARRMPVGVHSEELKEVEEELLQQGCKKVDQEDCRNDIESGTVGAVQASAHKRWYQVFLQALTLTFVAEWGDRSQIATIALAAVKNPIGVAIGGCVGHCLWEEVAATVA